MRYVALYNTQLPQSALRSRTPMKAMMDWHKSHPHLFVKSPRNLPGRDTAASAQVCTTGCPVPNSFRLAGLPLSGMGTAQRNGEAALTAIGGA